MRCVRPAACMHECDEALSPPPATRCAAAPGRGWGWGCTLPGPGHGGASMACTIMGIFALYVCTSPSGLYVANVFSRKRASASSAFTIHAVRMWYASDGTQCCDGSAPSCSRPSMHAPAEPGTYVSLSLCPRHVAAQARAAGCYRHLGCTNDATKERAAARLHPPNRPCSLGSSAADDNHVCWMTHIHTHPARCYNPSAT